MKIYHPPLTPPKRGISSSLEGRYLVASLSLLRERVRVRGSPNKNKRQK